MEAGADIHAKDTDGWTPLFWAVEGGHGAAVAALVGRGANGQLRSFQNRNFTVIFGHFLI